MNPEEVLDNIICARAHNSEQQYELLSDAAALMSDSRYGLHIPRVTTYQWIINTCSTSRKYIINILFLLSSYYYYYH